MQRLAILLLTLSALPARAQTPEETRAVVAVLTAAGSHHQADIPSRATNPAPAPSANTQPEATKPAPPPEQPSPAPKAD